MVYPSTNISLNQYYYNVYNFKLVFEVVDVSVNLLANKFKTNLDALFVYLCIRPNSINCSFLLAQNVFSPSTVVYNIINY